MAILEPTIAELIRRAVDSKLADVQIGPARAVPTVDGEIAYEPLPVLPKVPVLAFGTARSFVQAPLEPGDSVWLLFSETSAAEFLAGQDVTQPGDLARFSLSSCLALPFVRPGKATGAATLALLSDVQALVTALQASTCVNGSPLTFTPPTLHGTAEVKAK